MMQSLTSLFPVAAAVPSIGAGSVVPVGHGVAPPAVPTAPLPVQYESAAHNTGWLTFVEM